MEKLAKVITILLLFVAHGFADCRQSRFKVDVTKQEAAPALKASEGKALLVVFSEDWWLNIGLSVDERWVGATKHSKTTYFTVDLEPGEHLLCGAGGYMSTGSHVGYLRLQAEPGKVYFVELSSTFTGSDKSQSFRRILLKLVDPEQGNAEVRRARRTILKNVVLQHPNLSKMVPDE